MARNPDYEKAVWIALVNLVEQNWEEQGDIYYGDVRTLIAGSSRGSQSLNRPLGSISRRIDKHNSGSKERVPHLNSLVVGAKNKQAGSGIPYRDSKEKVWHFLKGKGLDWLADFGDQLGYPRRADYGSRQIEAHNRSKAFDPGSGRGADVKGFVRESTLHYDICHGILDHAKRLELTIMPGYDCKPDLVFRDYNDRKVLIEVKPSSAVGDLSAALGQLMFYDREVKAHDKILVYHGKLPSRSIRVFLSDYGIRIVRVNDKPPYISETHVNAIFKKVRQTK